MNKKPSEIIAEKISMILAEHGRRFNQAVHEGKTFTYAYHYSPEVDAILEYLDELAAKEKERNSPYEHEEKTTAGGGFW